MTNDHLQSAVETLEQSLAQNAGMDELLELSEAVANVSMPAHAKSAEPGVLYLSQVAALAKGYISDVAVRERLMSHLTGDLYDVNDERRYASLIGDSAVIDAVTVTPNKLDDALRQTGLADLGEGKALSQIVRRLSEHHWDIKDNLANPGPVTATAQGYANDREGARMINGEGTLVQSIGMNSLGYAILGLMMPCIGGLALPGALSLGLFGVTAGLGAVGGAAFGIYAYWDAHRPGRSDQPPPPSAAP